MIPAPALTDALFLDFDGTLVDMAPSGGTYVFRMTAPFPLAKDDIVYVENNTCPEANGVPHTVLASVDLGLPNIWCTVDCVPGMAIRLSSPASAMVICRVALRSAFAMNSSR